MRNFAIIEAPSVLGHIPTHLGVARMPEALLKAGLAERLGARHAGRVESPPWREERDPETQIMNPHAINEYSINLANKVGEVLDKGEFPVVIGGDCSILLGTLLGLRRRGRFGLFYLDGHADFYEAEKNPISGAASASDLGYATGRGPAVVADIEGRRPLLRDDDVVLFGYRDGAIQARNRCQPIPEDLLAYNRNEVRILGTETAAEEAVAHLTRVDGPEGFWIHVDVDVLDQGIMWACDHPQPDGFSWDDLATTLRTAMQSPQAIGIQFTIYNPDMDPGHLSGRGLAGTIARALAPFGQRQVG
ncbi:arginase family protein [Pseudomonas reactans]|uniref:arginase family protein n=1 Tax=Pseudomonas sp. NS1(2017) TaxID=2025658 RepID=UPI000BA1D48D|nr:arginase family protein [Pseudomonas sp. NS1(2017)]ASV38210.1 hypothetical protein CI807_19140 [Pseudomonas sp. NS1(2017)]